MSDVQMLKSSVNHRLTVAAEEEMILLKEEKDRQEKLLDSVFNPELHRAGVHQLMVKEEEVLPEQQERSSSLKQENPAEVAHIKEEQEEVWSSQEREQLQEPEEADIIKFTYFPVALKSEEGENEKEKPLEENRDTEHLKTEADGEDCGGSEPDRDFNPHNHLQPVSPDETSQLPGSDTDDSADWEESDEPQEGSNPPHNKDRAVSDLKCNTGDSSMSSSECAPGSGQKKQQGKRGDQTGEKSFSCSVCNKRYPSKKNLHAHMYRHTAEKPFSCSACEKSFITRPEMMRHMRVHTGEKPFLCSFCGKGFSQSAYLKEHLNIHIEEKSFSCSVCNKTYDSKTHLQRHMIRHSEEKPFSCSVCEKSFILKSEMVMHMRVHTKEKPFSCSLCGKRFTQNGTLKRHLIVHTGEKPFSCNVCGKSFTQLVTVKQHKCGGESRGNPK